MPSKSLNEASAVQTVKKQTDYNADGSKKPRVFVPKEGKTYKVTPIKIELLSNGEFKYPVIIGQNLRILDFGRID